MRPELQWGWTEVFSNKMVHALETLVWMKSKDAQKKLPLLKPKLFIPDFMEGILKDANNNVIEGEVHTTDDIQSILDMPRE